MTLSVNGVEIAEQAIHSEMQYHPAESAEQAQFEAARALVIRELLLQEAERHGVETGTRTASNEEQRIQALLERAVPVPQADAAACRRYFQNHPERFRTPVTHHVSHILLPVAPDDGAGRAAALAQAETWLGEICGHPGRFVALALQHSACPSRDAGGDLGPITRGQTVPEFEAALERLTIGEIAGRPVETRYGVHLVYLRDREGGDPLPFEAVQPQVAEYLDRNVQRRAIAQYLQRLIGEARIEGLELEGQTEPLMQ